MSFSTEARSGDVLYMFAGVMLWGLLVMFLCALWPSACSPVDQAAGAAPTAGEAALYQGETLCLVDEAARGVDVNTANAKCLIDPNDAGAAAHGAALVASCKAHFLAADASAPPTDAAGP